VTGDKKESGVAAGLIDLAGDLALVGIGAGA
jgi:hypothetical protein